MVEKNKGEREEQKASHDTYKLPYGLCAKYGISLPKGATPTDAWNALKGIGIKPSEAYKQLQEDGNADNIKPSGEKEVESKKKTKEELKQKVDSSKYIEKADLSNLSDAEKAELVKSFAHTQYPGTAFATMYDGKSDKSLSYTFNSAYGFNEEFTKYVNGKLSQGQTLEKNTAATVEVTNIANDENITKEQKPEVKREINEEAFSKTRKDNAKWFKGIKGQKESQEAYTPKLSEVWNGGTAAQKWAAIDYTAGSGGFNRPLRGYKNVWGASGYKGVGNVDLDNEGQKKEIAELTNLINSSSYSEDIWVQRGVDFDGAKQFFGVGGNFSPEKMKELVGKEFKDYGFQSCGASKGSGFNYNPCIFNVYCPAGTKMLYCAPFSHYGGKGISWDGSTPTGGGENEMLIQRQSTFRLTKAEQVDGKWYFDVEVTKQEIDDSVYQ